MDRQDRKDIINVNKKCDEILFNSKLYGTVIIILIQVIIKKNQFCVYYKYALNGNCFVNKLTFYFQY